MAEETQQGDNFSVEDILAFSASSSAPAAAQDGAATDESSAPPLDELLSLLPGLEFMESDDARAFENKLASKCKVSIASLFFSPCVLRTPCNGRRPSPCNLFLFDFCLLKQTVKISQE